MSELEQQLIGKF